MSKLPPKCANHDERSQSNHDSGGEDDKSIEHNGDERGLRDEQKSPTYKELK